MEIIEEILKLKDEECFVIGESDYGKAEIWKKNGMYFLFEIPMYGGNPNFSGVYPVFRIKEMIEEINSWT